ncbi:MAG: DUF2974 domain-containing protein [Lachnospiraceae bacterium]|nr:DUF2974 domain-containing protein [Lachnospiraceae bacterium]
MRELSEKELLLLSNYLYIDKCTEYGTINEMLDSCRGADGSIDEGKVAALGIGGCMSAQEGCRILNEMDACGAGLCSLSVARSIDAGGIRAICFESRDGDATVVFRGTGGDYEPWVDNVRGEYQSDTRMQKLADDFIRYDCGVYDSITVSGHSKGGNLAQYVTVLNNDRVDRCISFDGQGFGKGFFDSYAKDVGPASAKIKSICAHNDYVNLLLGAIACEIVFVKNRHSDPVGCHSSFALFDSCEFDKSGNIVNLTEQSKLMKGAKSLTSYLTGYMDSLPGEGGMLLSELLAANVAAVFSSELGEEYENERKYKAGLDVKRYLASSAGFDIKDPLRDVSIVTDELYIDPAGLKEAASLILNTGREMDAAALKLAELRHKIDYKAAAKLAVDIILRKAENKMTEYAAMTVSRGEALSEISRLYEEREKEILSCIGSITFA